VRVKKATGGYDDVPGDALRLLGEDGLKLMTRLINNIHENGEWPKDCTEVTLIALKKGQNIQRPSPSLSHSTQQK
jgi:hypothetical protein